MRLPEQKDSKIEHGQGETPRSLLKVVDGGQTAVERRSTDASEAIQAGRRLLSGTEQAHDLDGAVQDLATARRSWHTEVVKGLGALAAQKDPQAAGVLMERANRLLSVDEQVSLAA